MIDDRESLASLWAGKGGIFIHHTSVESTVSQLQGLILSINTSASSASAPTPSADTKVRLSLVAASGPKKDQTVPFLLESGKWESLRTAAKAKLRLQPSFVYARMVFSPFSSPFISSFI